jgi:hypothetical protein
MQPIDPQEPIVVDERAKATAEAMDTTILEDVIDEQQGPMFKVVMEPGTHTYGNYFYTGDWRCLQPCDKDQNPVEGERLYTSFVPTRMRVRDRNKYSPHQGKRECARRKQQQETQNHG